MPVAAELECPPLEPRPRRRGLVPPAGTVGAGAAGAPSDGTTGGGGWWAAPGEATAPLTGAAAARPHSRMTRPGMPPRAAAWRPAVSSSCHTGGRLGGGAGGPRWSCHPRPQALSGECQRESRGDWYHPQYSSQNQGSPLEAGSPDWRGGPPPRGLGFLWLIGGKRFAPIFTGALLSTTLCQGAARPSGESVGTRRSRARGSTVAVHGPWVPFKNDLRGGWPFWCREK